MLPDAAPRPATVSHPRLVLPSPSPHARGLPLLLLLLLLLLSLAAPRLADSRRQRPALPSPDQRSSSSFCSPAARRRPPPAAIAAPAASHWTPVCPLCVAPRKDNTRPHPISAPRRVASSTAHQTSVPVFHARASGLDRPRRA